MLGNDSDALGQPLTATLAGPATTEAGTISLQQDGSFTYTHRAGFVGTARYFYQAHAGSRTSADATILIDVQPAPLPNAQPDKFSMIAESGQLQGSVMTNDSDPLGQTMTALAVGSTELPHGFVSFNKDGSFFYFPDPGFTGTETFSYRLIAADSRTSDPAQVTIQVLANTAPVATAKIGGSVPSSGRSGTFRIGLSDALTQPTTLKVSCQDLKPCSGADVRHHDRGSDRASRVGAQPDHRAGRRCDRYRRGHAHGH